MTELGFKFEIGPEVPRPEPINWDGPWTERRAARRAWVDAMDDAIESNAACGLLCANDDGETQLFDVQPEPSRLLEATKFDQVYLLVAKEIEPVEEVP